eukprot:6208173-Pleurochrysis_carterae.AAC.4
MSTATGFLSTLCWQASGSLLCVQQSAFVCNRMDASAVFRFFPACSTGHFWVHCARIPLAARRRSAAIHDLLPQHHAQLREHCGRLPAKRRAAEILLQLRRA